MTLSERTTNPARQRSRTPAFALWPVLAIAGGVGLVLLLTSGRYGYHGDELYFIVAGHHLAWGYADQPPLVPLIARALDTILPHSPVVLRLPSTLLTAGGVVMTALTARELGGHRRAQILAAGAFACSYQFLLAGHMLATATIDPFLWIVLVWLLVRWVRLHQSGEAPDYLLWCAAGVTAVSLQTKYLVVALWAVIGIMALVFGPRDLLRRPALWIGGMLAGATAIPGLVWQANNGWPQLEMTRVISQQQADYSGGRLLLIPAMLFCAGLIVGVVLLCYGLWRLACVPELRPYRFLGCTVLGIAFVFLLSGARQYYIIGLFPVCWAAAAIAFQERTPARWFSLVTSWPAYAASAVFAVVMALPLSVPFADRDIDIAGTTGWPEMADEVSRIYHGLPERQRENAVIMADMYWQASALEVFGPERGLPEVYSGSIGYWWFGTPPEGTRSVLFVGSDRASLQEHFSHVRQVGMYQNDRGFPGQNKDIPIWVCTDPVRPWSEFWAQLRPL